MHKKHYTIPIFVPEMACPFRCIYCNQHLISGSINIPTPEDVSETIDKYLSTININENYVEVGFFGGSFTGIPVNEQIAFLNQVQPYIKNGSIQSIRLSTRPDYISENNLQILKEFNVKTIELGAQSLDNEVLKQSKRGHTVYDVEQASALIKSLDFDLGLQMMIGLPGDNFSKSIATAKKIIDLKADNTRIYPTIVIKDTYLEELFKNGKYQELTIDECINTLKIIIPMFENANVKIIRIGLHPSKDLQSGAYIAGPNHPSLRELAETEIWNDIFKTKLINPENKQNITISVSKEQFNNAIGYQAKNRKLLENYYKNIKFSIDIKLTNREFYADFN